MQTEIRKIAPSLPPAARVRPLAAVRRFVGRWGQIAALAALPACYGVHDLVYCYQAGSVAGHPLFRHDLSMLGFNFAFRRGPVQRHDLGLDRDRVHARLRDHRSDQLRGPSQEALAVRPELVSHWPPSLPGAPGHATWRTARRRPGDLDDHELL
jgi:hypothetical protein